MASPSMTFLTISFMPLPPSANLISLRPDCLIGFEHAEQHVVVIGPHRIDLWILGEIVLHQLEGFVAVPVCILDIEYLQLGAWDARPGNP